MRVSLVTRPKPDQAGTLPLYIRVAHAGKDRYVAIGLRVPASDWTPKRNEVRRSSTEHRRFNDLLRGKLRAAEAAAETALAERARHITPDELTCAVEVALHPAPETDVPSVPGGVGFGRPATRSPVAPALAADAVHLWQASLALDPADRTRLETLLSPDERDRAERFRYDLDRAAYVVTRGRLRQILGGYLGVEPGTVEIGYGARGKPRVEGPQTVQFNVSHAGRWALIAVARRRRVGVDIEAVRPLPDADAIVGRFFSAGEVAAYRALPPDIRPEAFVACWARKEAFVKALGDGLTYSLDAFDVSVHPDRPGALLETRDPEVCAVNWRLQDVPAPAGYRAAVAAEGADWHVLLV